MSEEQQQQQQQQQQQHQQRQLQQHHHQHHQQQHQQQQHQQQQQHPPLKASKDNPSGNPNAGAPPPAPTTAHKTNIHELRNQDYVSRLMAATPPYLYSTPVSTNNFFFSDMLRALVQARNTENARNLQIQQSVLATRRPRKRSWSHHRPLYEHLRERKEIEEKQQLEANAKASALNAEKPLELTNKPYFQLTHKYRKLDETLKELGAKATQSSVVAAVAKNGSIEDSATAMPSAPSAAASSAGLNSGGGGAIDSALQETPPVASLPPQDLVLPPPPPVWYPPLYPPYGIDPLHFFIDLRVSGHIYDRKKENLSPLTTATENNSANGDTEVKSTSPASLNLPNKHRHGSAFTVPVPRSNETKSATANHLVDAINLTSASANGMNKFENYAKYYDLGETKENQPISKCSANYMLQHLPRLYSQFAARDFINSNIESNTNNNGNTNSINNGDNDNKSEADCDGDSEGLGQDSTDLATDPMGSGNRERDIDVEIIDSIKYRNDGDSSRCTSPDDGSITHID